LKFVPVPNKSSNNTTYSLGLISGMVWCEVDIKEVLRYSGKILKADFAILFPKKIENVL
jgi:hypothetical protein